MEGRCSGEDGDAEKHHGHLLSVHFKFILKPLWLNISDGKLYGESPLKDKTSIPGLFGDLSYEGNEAKKNIVLIFFRCKTQQTQTNNLISWSANTNQQLPKQ